jgi:glycosyltransferase involved in cell wall biosynthesis
VVWYPAQWPETYSYTLSLALHCGLPVVVPDIGAFPERVARRDLSAVVPWNLSTMEWQAFWREVLASGTLPANRLSAQEQGAVQAADNNFYRDDYLQAVTVTAGQLTKETLDSLADNYYLLRAGLSRSERVLRGIWRVSRSPFVAKCVACRLG